MINPLQHTSRQAKCMTVKCVHNFNKTVNIATLQTASGGRMKRGDVKNCHLNQNK